VRLGFSDKGEGKFDKADETNLMRLTALLPQTLEARWERRSAPAEVPPTVSLRADAIAPWPRKSQVCDPLVRLVRHSSC
jgi:hypothetical protein